MKASRHERFHLQDLVQLRAELARLGAELALSEDLGVLSRPLQRGRWSVPNRFVAQPMEGFDAGRDGSPGELTFRRYRRYAAGGFGLIWVEATAVLPEARSNPGQLLLHEDNVDAFRKLADAVRLEADRRCGRVPALVIQLTHSGRYSKPHGVPCPIIAHHSPVLDPLHGLGPDQNLVTDEYLDRLGDRYVAVARLAGKAGFDGVDIKSCHRYLISELLASFTRGGRYGGTFENRTRLLLETVSRIREEVPELLPTVRMNAYDAIPYPYGFGVDRDDFRVPDLTEPLRLAAALRDAGVELLNVSLGNPYYNPHYGRPYDFPVRGSAVPDEHPLEGIARFAEITRRIQQAQPEAAVVGSGYTWLRHLMPHAAAGAIESGGAALFGIGRGAFAYPATPREVMETGRMDPRRCCVACSACTQIMRDGGRTGCVVRDSEIYGPEYRRARRFAVDRLREEAQRCRNCAFASCIEGCPARVNVPAFVRAFADGDIRSAYRILRESNVLPEMCGAVCPSEMQCEGHCVEDTFCRHPIPIRDIQLVTCRLARRAGWTGLALPPRSSGKSVAVVGGGPAGVAAAVKLLEAGQHVTVYERGGGLGGTPGAAIPRERYGDAGDEISGILEPARAGGRLVERYGSELGADLELDGLCARFDAVVLALGLGGAVSLGRAAGVVDALAFLRGAKQGGDVEVPARVAVLGGGNTALDAALTARRCGARDVYLVYRRSFSEMPAWPAERDRFLQSGGHVLILTQPIGYVTDEHGTLSGIRVLRTELGEPDGSGRRRPVPVAGSESVLSVELAIEALGQVAAPGLRAALPGVELTAGGRIALPRADSMETSRPGVFAAGDLVNGGATAVQGIAEGMRAAEEINGRLCG